MACIHMGSCVQCYICNSHLYQQTGVAVLASGQASDGFCMLYAQDQDAVHKAWLLGNKLLLGLHMASRTALHKAAPSMFGGPRMMGVAMGNSAYRGLMSAMYRDGIMLAGGLAAAAALVVRTMC